MTVESKLISQHPTEDISQSYLPFHMLGMPNKWQARCIMYSVNFQKISRKKDVLLMMRSNLVFGILLCHDHKIYNIYFDLIWQSKDAKNNNRASVSSENSRRWVRYPLLIIEKYHCFSYANKHIMEYLLLT